MSVDEAAVAAVLVELVARHLRLDPAELGPDTDLTELGLDSLQAVELATDLGERFGFEVDHALFFEFPSVAALAAAIAAS